jgi:endonuclease YncB( thermonuclease family)
LLIGVALAALIAMMAIAEGQFDPSTGSGQAEGIESCAAPEGLSLAVCVPQSERPGNPYLTVLSTVETCDLRVDRVSDGDTFHAKTTTLISPTNKIEESAGFRMLRVYAPERKEPGYDQAKRDLATMIEGRMVQVYLPPKGPRRDKYGRFLVEVYICTPSGRVNVNDAMRAAGWTDKGKGLPKK